MLSVSRRHCSLERTPLPWKSILRECYRSRQYCSHEGWLQHPRGYLAAQLTKSLPLHLQTSEYAPKIHTFLAEILTEAGLPEGVLNVLHIAPEDSPAVRSAETMVRIDQMLIIVETQVCEAIIAHRAVGKLNFTGKFITSLADSMIYATAS